MAKNEYLEKLVMLRIEKMIQRGELYTPEMVDIAVKDNLGVWTKMMTVSVNKGVGVGKKRFDERVQPILDQLTEEFFHNKKTADEQYAISVIERLYDEIMED